LKILNSSARGGLGRNCLRILFETIGTMDKDCNRAIASCIDRSVDVRQQFSFDAPDLTLKMIQALCSDGYGSWNTCVKLVHDVPRSTFTYLVEGFLAKEQTSLRNQILSRY
jgi:hypothetical protein